MTVDRSDIIKLKSILKAIKTEIELCEDYATTGNLLGIYDRLLVVSRKSKFTADWLEKSVK